MNLVATIQNTQAQKTKSKNPGRVISAPKL